MGDIRKIMMFQNALLIVFQNVSLSFHTQYTWYDNSNNNNNNDNNNNYNNNNNNNNIYIYCIYIYIHTHIHILYMHLLWDNACCCCYLYVFPSVFSFWSIRRSPCHGPWGWLLMALWTLNFLPERLHACDWLVVWWPSIFYFPILIGFRWSSQLTKSIIFQRAG